MKSILTVTLVSILFSIVYSEIPKWQIEAYERSEEIKKAERILADSDAKLKTAIAATEYARELFGTPNFSVVKGLIITKETDNRWNIKKGDVVWWIRGPLLDNGITDPIMITAKDGIHLIDKNQNQSE